ncbi:indole-3-glycerol phosphate synthase [Pilatotrama ljubarskyi]|nr:indole-3-glycerol phosphate synthase [Pilatotrama ljubarskyi]
MGLAPPLVPFLDRLKRNPSTATAHPSLSLMAEIKRASPSKGDIAPFVNPARQALLYAQSGASVISVLTEPTWFKGSLLDMRLARAAVDGVPDRPAILRKEFIFCEYQIAEARLWGADTVLLIVAMLTQEQLPRLYAYAVRLGMEPVVEVNNATEMARALEIGAKVVGVNNRNLHDFSVDLGTTSALVDMVRERDVVQGQGVNAVLVGESLMRATDTKGFIKQLLAWPDA